MKRQSLVVAILGGALLSPAYDATPTHAVEFVREWEVVTTRGDDAPAGLTVDASGELYVTSWTWRYVLKYDAMGATLLQWGGYASEPGGFGYSGLPDIGPDGNVYFSDYRQVQVCSPNGQLIRTIGADLPEESALGHVAAVAVGPNGAVSVCDLDHHRVVDFDADGQYLGSWGIDGTSATQFSAPVAIEIDADGSLLVADFATSVIHRFGPDRTPLATWGGNGTADGLFNGPAGLAIDGEGRVYVTDHGNNRIQVFDSGGSLLFQWGTEGTLPGQFRDPSGIAISPAGLVYVADHSNTRIQVFSATVAVSPTTWTRIKSSLSRR